MINQCVFAGRITEDPVVKVTQNGSKLIGFTLAVNRPKAKSGEKNTDFIHFNAFDKNAEFMEMYVKKGNLLGVTGSLRVISRPDENGKYRNNTFVLASNVTILSSKNSSEQNAIQNSKKNEYSKKTYGTNTGVYDDSKNPYSNYGNDEYYENDFASQLDISSDDLPF